MSMWDRMGHRPIHFEDDVYRNRNGFGRYGKGYYEEVYDQNQFGYVGCGYNQQNQWSRDEEEDEELKELFKEFIKIQNDKDEELMLSLEMLNEKLDQFEQDLRENQVRLHELEMKFERLYERLEHQGGYYGIEEQNGWSKNEEDDDSLTDLMKTFIQVQNDKDEELEMSLGMLNMKIEQNLSDHQARLQDLERKFEQLNEWLENQQTGHISSFIHSNPSLSNNVYDQGLRCQTPLHKAKNTNARDTRSGFDHGNGEEHNGDNEKKFSAVGPPLATQSMWLRGNTTSVPCFLSVKSSIASQSFPLRSNSPKQPGNDPKAHLEVGNHMGDEPMVYYEDKTPNYTPNLPIGAYESRKEDSLETELQELLGTSLEGVDDTIDVEITLDEFERLFDISEGPDVVNVIVVEGEKELESMTGVDKEIVQAQEGEPCKKLKADKNSNSESKGVLQDMKDGNDRLLDFDAFLDGEPTRSCFEKDKYGGLVGKCRRIGNVSIMRETREWHDAMVKARMRFDVATYGIPCDDVVCRNVGECGVFERWYEKKNGGNRCFQISLLV